MAEMNGVVVHVQNLEDLLDILLNLQVNIFAEHDSKFFLVWYLAKLIQGQ
jgi:hypothetical protein